MSLAGCTIVPVVLGDETTKDDSVRGDVYCEIMSYPTPDGQTRIAANSTCPTSPGFFDVTEEMVVTTHGPDTTEIGFNGRREKMMDEVIPFNDNTSSDNSVSNNVGEVVEYGSNIFADGSGFEMEIIAYMLQGSNVFYTRGLVARNFALVWRAGSRAYLIVC